MPKKVEVFGGTWVDSYGNSVHVEVNDDTANVTLTKRVGGGRNKWHLFFDDRVQSWRCGNGFLGELVYQDDARKGKVLSFVSWTTKWGCVSTWIRSAVDIQCPGPQISEASLAVPASDATEDEEAVSQSFTKKPQAREVSPSTEASASSVLEKDSQAAARAIGLSTLGRQSWYEITQEWDESEGPQEFVKGEGWKHCGQRWVESDKATDQETKQKRTTRGRRGGRNRRGNRNGQQ